LVSVSVLVEELTIDEYVRLYESEGAFEIINGERIPLVPPVMIHIVIVKLLVEAFLAYERQTGRGEAFSEAPYVLVESKNWVKGSRVPGVMYYAAERLKAYREAVPDWKTKPLILVPDLVVEVVSANDRYTDIQDKVEVYQNDGVKLIWVIDPHRQKVIVHQGDIQTVLSAQDTLSGGEVIPGFEMPIAALFV
jgi:Uma2 family endonuclease